MELNVKEKLIEYLEANELRYIIWEDKISHACINPEHKDSSPSAFTTLVEGEEFNHCSSCKFHLNTEKLYNFLEIGIDPNEMFLLNIKNILKQDNKVKIKHQPSQTVYLPIKDKEFDKTYRSISPETYSKVGAYSTVNGTFYGRRIIIPIRDFKGKLKTFEAVSTNAKIQPKVLRPKGTDTTDFFGFEDFMDADTIFIVEGVFDALSLLEVGLNPALNFGLGSIKGKLRTLLHLGIKNIILCGDNDDVGKEFNKECYQILKHNFNVGFFSYPFDMRNINKLDLNDTLKKLGKEKFKEHCDKVLERNMIVPKLRVG